jgi:hypothetical protein
MSNEAWTKAHRAFADLEHQLSATRAELAEARAALLAKYGGSPYYVSGPYATDGRLIEGTAHDDALVAIYVRVKHLRAALAPVTESASDEVSHE